MIASPAMPPLILSGLVPPPAAGGEGAAARRLRRKWLIDAAGTGGSAAEREARARLLNACVRLCADLRVQAAPWLEGLADWLGVGPGNFRSMMEIGEYAVRHLPLYGGTSRGATDQAHNMLLQASAELGLAGALVLLLLWRSMIVSCLRAWASDCVPLIALGTGGAMSAYLLRSIADSFMDILMAADRTRILIALFFGVALALNRMTTSRVLRPE